METTDAETISIIRSVLTLSLLEAACYYVISLIQGREDGIIHYAADENKVAPNYSHKFWFY